MPSPQSDPNQPKPLSLRPKAAAPALGISERHLADLTKAGLIPCVRLGRAVVYPVSVLEEFLAQQAKKGEGQP
jgi:hypothetical protein